MTDIGNAYAQALYSLAAEEGLSHEILAEMKALDEAFSAEPDFLRLLASPSLTKAERTEVVDKSFRGKIAPYLLNFIKILTENGYVRHFSECYRAYRDAYNADNGILPVKAVTAVPLTEAQAEKLSAKLSGITGKRVELTNIIDPACLGGVRLDYAGVRVDDTVQHRLDAVHALLKNTVL